MPNLNDFGNRIEGIGIRFDQKRKQLRILTALAVDQALVLATPVDKGRARSNWQVSVGRPILAEIEPYAPGDKLGLGETANASGALEQARAALARDIGEEPIYITNNVEYINVLNAGHSAQAPAGFVEEALAAGLAVVRGMKLT